MTEVDPGGEMIEAAVAADEAAASPEPARHATVARGARIEVMRMGVARRGRVEFVSALQILVKWDDGGSSGLRLDRDDWFRIVHPIPAQIEPSA